MRTLVLAGLVALLPALAPPAAADPAVCQKTIARQYAVLAKKTLKGVARCLDRQNTGDQSGACPDATTAAKLDAVRQKVEAKVAATCSTADAAALGFVGCSFGLPEGSAAETVCRSLPAGTPGELAACITCWKQADFAEFLAFLYASHAVELCGGVLGLASTTCSQGGCAAFSGVPDPDQRDLGDGGEHDCQRGIAKAGVKYLLTREKLLTGCALAAGTRASCLADPAVALKTGKAAARMQAVIEAACGSRTPRPDVPFCCRTTGDQCLAAPTRAGCLAGGGTVEEEATCGPSATCDPVPEAERHVTWWETCPRRACGNTAVTTLAELIACTGDKADEIAAGLLCYQFPSPTAAWICPSSPSGAFVD